MITGELKRWRSLEGTQGLAAGFEFLERGDLATLPMGRHSIEGDSAFALAMQSPSREPEAGKFEAHQEYIDIQYLVSGQEVIGVAPVAGLQVTTPYDAAKDVVFYALPAAYQELEIRPGHFAVLFPGEGHLPLCHSHGPHDLHKVVVKVKLDYWKARRQA
jgi:YhcH/YjgK/YiaL family protein